MSINFFKTIFTETKTPDKSNIRRKKLHKKTKNILANFTNFIAKKFDKQLSYLGWTIKTSYWSGDLPSLIGSWSLFFITGLFPWLYMILWENFQNSIKLENVAEFKKTAINLICGCIFYSMINLADKITITGISLYQTLIQRKVFIAHSMINPNKESFTTTIINDTEKIYKNTHKIVKAMIQSTTCLLGNIYFIWSHGVKAPLIIASIGIILLNTTTQLITNCNAKWSILSLTNAKNKIESEAQELCTEIEKNGETYAMNRNNRGIKENALTQNFKDLYEKQIALEILNAIISDFTNTIKKIIAPTIVLVIIVFPQMRESFGSIIQLAVAFTQLFKNGTTLAKMSSEQAGAESSFNRIKKFTNQFNIQAKNFINKNKNPYEKKGIVLINSLIFSLNAFATFYWLTNTVSNIFESTTRLIYFKVGLSNISSNIIFIFTVNTLYLLLNRRKKQSLYHILNQLKTNLSTITTSTLISIIAIISINLFTPIHTSLITSFLIVKYSTPILNVILTIIFYLLQPSLQQIAPSPKNSKSPKNISKGDPLGFEELNLYINKQGNKPEAIVTIKAINPKGENSCIQWKKGAHIIKGANGFGKSTILKALLTKYAEPIKNNNNKIKQNERKAYFDSKGTLVTIDDNNPNNINIGFSQSGNPTGSIALSSKNFDSIESKETFKNLDISMTPLKLLFLSQTISNTNYPTDQDKEITKNWDHHKQHIIEFLKGDGVNMAKDKISQIEKHETIPKDMNGGSKSILNAAILYAIFKIPEKTKTAKITIMLDEPFKDIDKSNESKCQIFILEKLIQACKGSNKNEKNNNTLILILHDTNPRITSLFDTATILTRDPQKPKITQATQIKKEEFNIIRKRNEEVEDINFSENIKEQLDQQYCNHDLFPPIISKNQFY